MYLNYSCWLCFSLFSAFLSYAAVKIYGYNTDGKLINLPDWLIYSPFYLPGFGNVADTGAAYCRTWVDVGCIPSTIRPWFVYGKQKLKLESIDTLKNQLYKNTKA